MPPTRGTDAKHVFWAAALAVLRRRAAVVEAETRYEYPERDCGGWGPPARTRGRTETTLDLRVRLGNSPLELDDGRQLELAVAAMLAERFGMRLVPQTPASGSQAVAATATPRPSDEERARDLDDAAARFGLMELD